MAPTGFLPRRIDNNDCRSGLCSIPAYSLSWAYRTAHVGRIPSVWTNDRLPILGTGYPLSHTHKNFDCLVPLLFKQNKKQIAAALELCRKNKWNEVTTLVRSNRSLAVTRICMDNRMTTTILHQLITSKGKPIVRAALILEILEKTPEAASIKNGYSSLPLHQITQRNIRMPAKLKEKIMIKLVQANKGALAVPGGVAKRTPLHILFTDYISPELTEFMIENGREACFIKDKNGYLPAHVACSRHCSAVKLQMLLNVNPAALYDKTVDGETILDLAIKTASKAHPNNRLIETIRERIGVDTTDSGAVATATKPAAVHSSTLSPMQIGLYNTVSLDEDSWAHGASVGLRSLSPASLMMNLRMAEPAQTPRQEKNNSPGSTTTEVVPTATLSGPSQPGSPLSSVDEAADLLLLFSRRTAAAGGGASLSENSASSAAATSDDD